jgi:hypothetical protein
MANLTSHLALFSPEFSPSFSGLLNSHCRAISTQFVDSYKHSVDRNNSRQAGSLQSFRRFLDLRRFPQFIQSGILNKGTLSPANELGDSACFQWMIFRTNADFARLGNP